MNNGQMDRGNEDPTQHLFWWLRETTKKTHSGWSAPEFEPVTSRIQVCFHGSSSLGYIIIVIIIIIIIIIVIIIIIIYWENLHFISTV